MGLRLGLQWFHCPPPSEFDSKLRWPGHPNPDTLSIFFFVGFFEYMSNYRMLFPATRPHQAT